MTGLLDRRAFTGAAFLLPAMPAVPGVGTSLAAVLSPAEDVVLRSFVPADADTVSLLVAASYGGDDAKMSSLAAVNRALHLASPTSTGWHRTIVAELGGQVIGVASGMRSPLHAAARVHVIVDGRHRRMGTGTQLFAAIARQTRSENLQIISTILGTEEAAWRFASACGMNMLMHARQIRVDTRSWAVDLWTDAVLEGKVDFRLAPGTAFPPERLFAAIDKAYFEMHRRWIATVPAEPGKAESTWGRKISPAHAALALQGDAVVGAAALIAAEDKRAILFPAAACGPMSDIKAERRLVGTLIADRLVAARDAGFTEVLIECDDDDGRMLEVLGSIPAIGLIEIFTLTMGSAGHWPRRLA